MDKLSLLYAEDDLETRENLTYILKNYFNEVYLGKDGKEALDIYYKEKPDVLFLDIDMPYIDGMEIINTVRKNNKNIPIIILTACTETNTLLNAIPFNLTAYLVKPVDEDILRETISNIISEIAKKDSINLKEGLIWNKKSSNLIYYDNHIKLTKKERQFINILIDNLDNYLSSNELISKMWDDNTPENFHNNNLIQIISRLNMKIMKETNSITHLIENNYGLGYKLAYSE